MSPTIKPLLILDVDETLIHATESPLDRTCDFRVGPYSVYRRPYLTEFWEACQTRYELAVWSSSGEDYLTAILARIVPDGISLRFAWSQDRCVRRFDPETCERYFVKDVKPLGYHLDRVLIVDDSPEKVERNYGNAIYMRPFEGDPADEELPRLARYLAAVSGCTNFRQLEKRGWRSLG